MSDSDDHLEINEETSEPEKSIMPLVSYDDSPVRVADEEPKPGTSQDPTTTSASSFVHNQDVEPNEDSYAALSDSSTEDETCERCAICLSRMKDDIGSPDAKDCDHAFCLLCILEWAKNNPTCPQDRRPFENVLVREFRGGAVINTIAIDRPKASEIVIDDEEVTVCEICDSSENEDRLLLCDGCDLGFHLYCLTPPLHEVPVEEWFCPMCIAVDVPKAIQATPSRKTQNSELPSTRRQRNQRSRDGRNARPRRRPRRRMIPRTRATERVLDRIARTRLKNSYDKNSNADLVQAFKTPKPFGSVEDNDIDAVFNKDLFADMLLKGQTSSPAMNNEQKKAAALELIHRSHSVPSASYGGRSNLRTEIASPSQSSSDILGDILTGQSTLLSKSKDIAITEERKLITISSSGNDSSVEDMSMSLENNIMEIPLPSQRKENSETKKSSTSEESKESLSTTKKSYVSYKESRRKSDSSSRSPSKGQSSSYKYEKIKNSSSPSKKRSYEDKKANRYSRSPDRKKNYYKRDRYDSSDYDRNDSYSSERYKKYSGDGKDYYRDDKNHRKNSYNDYGSRYSRKDYEKSSSSKREFQKDMRYDKKDTYEQYNKKSSFRDKEPYDYKKSSHPDYRKKEFYDDHKKSSYDRKRRDSNNDKESYRSSDKYDSYDGSYKKGSSREQYKRTPSEDLKKDYSVGKNKKFHSDNVDNDYKYKHLQDQRDSSNHLNASRKRRSYSTSSEESLNCSHSSNNSDKKHIHSDKKTTHPPQNDGSNEAKASSNKFESQNIQLKKDINDKSAISALSYFQIPVFPEKSPNIDDHSVEMKLGSSPLNSSNDDLHSWAQAAVQSCRENQESPQKNSSSPKAKSSELHVNNLSSKLSSLNDSISDSNASFQFINDHSNQELSHNIKSKAKVEISMKNKSEYPINETKSHNLGVNSSSSEESSKNTSLSNRLFSLFGEPYDPEVYSPSENVSISSAESPVCDTPEKDSDNDSADSSPKSVSSDRSISYQTKSSESKPKENVEHLLKSLTTNLHELQEKKGLKNNPAMSESLVKIIQNLKDQDAKIPSDTIEALSQISKFMDPEKEGHSSKKLSLNDSGTCSKPKSTNNNHVNDPSTPPLKVSGIQYYSSESETSPSETDSAKEAYTPMDPMDPLSPSLFVESMESMESAAKENREIAASKGISEIAKIESFLEETNNKIRASTRHDLEFKIVEHCKKWLDPYYQNKSLTKDLYKEIVSKSVSKILKAEASLVVDSTKIKKLVEGYVKLYQHRMKKKSKHDDIL